MDDIVAVRVTLERAAVFFLTWGRVLDAVDPVPTEEAVRTHAVKTAGVIKEQIQSVELCGSLQEAAAEAPFFFEAFFEMAQERPRRGLRRKSWRRTMARQIRTGRQIWFLGWPDDRA